MTEHPDTLQLSAHLDQELDIQQSTDVSRHLLQCRACRRQYQQLRELSHDLQQLAEIRPAVDIASLLAPLPQRVSAPVTFRSERRSLSGLAAAAALVMGLLLGNALQPPSPASTEPAFAALSILDSTPPGALCGQPELCYLKGTQ